ncbi:hypothetical protein JTB14_020027 [Gonioctena quinquepunctata]|nr:hypothetical protein JTB14_020027 [Gonioctena quinquepunctata]
MRRSCRIVTEEQEKINQEKKRKRKMSPEEKENKTLNREERLKREKKGEEKCTCGETTAKHKFLISKENHIVKVMCAGNKERTERGCGYETITEKELEVLESRKLEQYRSGYQESEDDNKEVDSKMETNQMERKIGSPPPGLKGAYVELIRSDKLIAEKKREQEKLEKDKREQLRKIREKQKEKEKVEKSEETPAKGKTYIKPKTEMPRLATSENNKINSSSESQRTQEESSEAEAGRKGILEVSRLEKRQKKSGKAMDRESQGKYPSKSK